MNIALILVASTNKQNICFWPSYNNISSIKHDLIVVHRNNQFLPKNIENKSGGNIYLENKVFNDKELQHKAFGAYRYYFEKYKNKYDFFAFVSDDVIIKSDNWLTKGISPLVKYDKLGWTSTQIFNSGKNSYKYPHASHSRSPAWFAKQSSLIKINWKFDSDHLGEMSLANQFLDAGFFGIQVGNKINLAYDALEENHISQLLELKYFDQTHLRKKFTLDENEKLNNTFQRYLDNNDDIYLTSPIKHIGKRNIITGIEPFDNLIFDKSVNIAKENCEIKTFKKDINVII